jgi:hypothetical protein
MNARIPLRIVAQNQHSMIVAPWDFSIRAVYEYDEGEAPIWSPLERAHPGTPPNAQLLEAWVGGVDIYEMLRPEQIERLEDAILESTEGATS